MKVYIDKVEFGEDGKSYDLFAESDGVQFLLVAYGDKYVEKKTNQEKQKRKILGYYRSLYNVFNDVLKLKIMASNADTVSELMSNIEELNRHMQELFFGINIYGGEIGVDKVKFIKQT